MRASIAVNGRTLIEYPQQPYTLAAYSAPMPARPLPLVRWSAVRRGADPRGALVVADGHAAFGVITGMLAAAGAAARLSAPRRGGSPGAPPRREPPDPRWNVAGQARSTCAHSPKRPARRTETGSPIS
jgi:hypothetical protein